MTLREKLEQLKASEDKNKAIMEAFNIGYEAGISVTMTAAQFDDGCVFDEGAEMRIVMHALDSAVLDANMTKD